MKYKTLTCPYCQKPTSPTSRLCGHCNGPLFDKGKSSTKPICPRCHSVLKFVTMEGDDEAELCQKCHGLWLDFQNFKRITRTGRIPKEYVESKKHWHKPLKKDIQYLSCPRCGRFMNRANFSSISAIIIDRCWDHGVWLDGGELERIRLFIAAGCLKQYQDKRLERIEEALQRVAAHARENEFTTKLLHKWNPKRIIFRGF